MAGLADNTQRSADDQLDPLENLSDEQIMAMSPAQYEAARRQTESTDADENLDDHERDDHDSERRDVRADHDDSQLDDQDDDEQEHDQEDAEHSAQDGDQDDDQDDEQDDDQSNNAERDDDESSDPDDDDDDRDVSDQRDHRGVATGDVSNLPDDATDQQGAGKKSDQKQSAQSSDKASGESIDYEREYNRLLAPFKANGHNIQVRSIDEAITLMQQGAHFNKKMTAIKPHMKTIKLLENSGVNTPEQLNYLLDLQQKNPKAISKLLADSQHDDRDYEHDDGVAYVPTPRSISDQEMALDEVMSEIKETPQYNDTIRIVGKQWDTASRDAIANQAQLLKTINVQVGNGIYDVINTEMERMRALGQLNGLTDLDAYQQIGARIDANGGFDHLTVNPADYGLPAHSPQGQQRPASTKRLPSKQARNDEQLNQRRKAAGASKASASAKKRKADFNPLAMSDEDFIKQYSPQLQ